MTPTIQTVQRATSPSIPKIQQPGTSTSDPEAEAKRHQYDELSELEWLQNRADYLNSKAGKRPDWFSYDCKLCKNRGYITVVREEDLTLDSEICQCQKLRNTYRFASAHGMAGKLNLTLDDFKVTEQWQEPVKGKAVSYVTIDPEDRWFVMLGQPGSGKTLLCSIVTAEQVKKGREVRATTWPDIIDTLKRNMKGNQPDNTVEELKRCEVLFLDDFFKSPPTAWEKDVAFRLIDYRYSNNLRTIISSEKDVTKLNGIDRAISSRIQQKAGPYINIIAEDDKKNRRITK